MVDAYLFFAELWHSKVGYESQISSKDKGRLTSQCSRKILFLRLEGCLRICSQQQNARVLAYYALLIGLTFFLRQLPLVLRGLVILPSSIMICLSA